MKTHIKQLKSGVAWSLFSKVIASGTGFFITLLLVRVLTLDHLGLYYLIQTIILFSGIFVKVGLDLSVQKINGIYANNRNWSMVRRCTKSMLLIFSISTIIVLVCLAVIWPELTINLLKSPSLSTMMVLIFIAIPLRSAEQLGSAFFRSIHESKIGVLLLDIPRQLMFLTVLLIISFLYKKSSLENIFTVYVLSSGIAVFITTYLIYRWFKKKEDISKDIINREVTINSLFYLSFPMMLQGSASIIMASSDIWVLSSFSTSNNVGIYGTVVRLTSLIILMLSVVNMVLPPMLASLYKNNNKVAIEKLLRLTATWNAFVAIPLLIIFLLYGDTILSYIFGDTFSKGYYILIILACAHTVNALTGSPGMLLQMTGKHNVLMKITIFWSVFNLLTNIIFVQFWGVVGVALATGISVVFQNINMIFLSLRYHHIKTWMYQPLTVFK